MSQNVAMSFTYLVHILLSSGRFYDVVWYDLREPFRMGRYYLHVVQNPGGLSLGGPGNSSNPGNPVNSGNSRNSGNSGKSGNPGNPGNSGNSGKSETRETRETREARGSRETWETPTRDKMVKMMNYCPRLVAGERVAQIFGRMSMIFSISAVNYGPISGNYRPPS